jgi:uncharacterized membrane protein
MAAPFPEAQLEPLIYILLGALSSMVVVLGLYIRRLHEKLDGATGNEKTELRVDQIGLSKRSEDVLEHVIETPELQSDLPGEIGVSKATISNAVSELFDRGLVKKKKKANTYLIEPEIDKIREEQR